MVTVLHTSVVKSAVNANHRNKRVSFKSDVQELLKLLDTKPRLFGKIVIISVNQETLIMICKINLGLRKITQTRILAVELGPRYTA
jgi:hypothetical protein